MSSSNSSDKLIIAEDTFRDGNLMDNEDTVEVNGRPSKASFKGKKRIAQHRPSEQSDNEEEEMRDNNDGKGNGKWFRRNFKRGTEIYEGGSKRKYAKISSDDDDDDYEDEEEKVSEKLLWKIVKSKFIFTFKLCKVCNNRLFNDPKKFAYVGNLLRLKVMFCPHCVKLNIAACDLLEGTGIQQKNNKWNDRRTK